jgi:hypothetical protein
MRTVYERKFLPSEDHDPFWDEDKAWAEAEWEKTKADMARRYQERGDDPETARLRAEWRAWRISEYVKNMMLYGTPTAPLPDS